MVDTHLPRPVESNPVERYLVVASWVATMAVPHLWYLMLVG